MDTDSDSDLLLMDTDSDSYIDESKILTSPKGNVLRSYPYKRESILGTPLAQVLSVSINPITPECKLYGTIHVEDDKGIVDYLFDLDQEDPELISRDSSDNSLLLCQTNRAILATTYFKLHFDLKDGDSVFLKESFSWYALTDEDYDKPLDKTVAGKYGSATVYYIVHSLAVEANIAARFFKNETVSSSIHVKGTIFVWYKNMRYDFDESDGLSEYTQVKIFEENAVEMKDEETLPLDRTLVAVPLYYPFRIEVDLRKVSEGEGDEGEVLWNEKVEFPLTILLTDKEIRGPHGVLRLILSGFNYANKSFAQVEKFKAMMRKRGFMSRRWTYLTEDSSDDECQMT